MISVVIPTRERSEILARTLSSLAHQAPPPAGYEVVVVDNGSTDATRQLVLNTAQSFPVRLRLLDEPQPGPAAARNRGAAAAGGSVLLFLGDDMVPATGELVAGHAEFHERRPGPNCALLGHATWHPHEAVSPFMRWLEEGGPQFAYGAITAGRVPTATYFYTANVSLKKQTFLDAGSFNERFPYAAVEDIELGTRLEDRGVELVYDPRLVVHHVHPTVLADSLQRMERVGRSAALYHLLRPDCPLDRELPIPKRSLYLQLAHLLARLLAAEGIPRSIRERAWLILHRAAYERGYALGPPDSAEALAD